jgi:hypothetical protein
MQYNVRELKVSVFEKERPANTMWAIRSMKGQDMKPGLWASIYDMTTTTIWLPRLMLSGASQEDIHD